MGRILRVTTIQKLEAFPDNCDSVRTAKFSFFLKNYAILRMAETSGAKKQTFIHSPYSHEYFAAYTIPSRSVAAILCTGLIAHRF
jgi:hypothetical protein